MLKFGSEYVCLWVAIEPENRLILELSISKERNIFVAIRFLSGLIKIHRKHAISTDGGTWYPQACGFLNLDHIHSFLVKNEINIIERTMQYIKDGTESFDYYFLCRIKNCKLKHVRNWLRFFVDYHNKEVNPFK